MKEKVVNSVLLIASVIFSLLVLEVALRVAMAYENDLWPLKNQLRNFRHFPFLESTWPVTFDAELGWVPTHEANTNPWGTTVTILEDGTRSNGGGEVSDPIGAILAVGDSYTFGDQVSDWETWTARLEKLSGRKVSNGGGSAYGIDQAFLRARRLLSQYRFPTVIFSFIPEDIERCQLSQTFSAGKPYFDFKDGRLTLENVPVPPPRRRNESKLLKALEHSLLVHYVLKRLFPEWWLLRTVQVLDEKKATQVACALLHELESLTQTRGSELIILVQYPSEDVLLEPASMAVKSVLSCLSDPATRVLDLKPALSELHAKDLSKFNRLYKVHGGHMTAEGNQFVALEISKFLNQRSTQVDRGILSPAR